nr:hypothetical protein CFP56_43611 [Quercus suber]
MLSFTAIGSTYSTQFIVAAGCARASAASAVDSRAKGLKTIAVTAFKGWRSAIGRHCFYVYYDGEQYFHDLHRLSYEGESVKKKFIQLKCKTHLRKMHRKIMEALGLDKESHKISIVYRAPPATCEYSGCLQLKSIELRCRRGHDVGSD